MLTVTRVSPEKMTSFAAGIEQFNQQDFYACHDTLEAVWLEAEPGDKRFYQGILQVAVGCYHLQNQNHAGAMILLGEGIHRLKHYRPDYQNIDVEALLQDSNRLLRTLQALEPDTLSVWLANQDHGELILRVSWLDPNR